MKIDDVNFEALPEMLANFNIYGNASSITNENETLMNIALLVVVGPGVFEVIKELGVDFNVKMNVIDPVDDPVNVSERYSDYSEGSDGKMEMDYYRAIVRKNFKDVVFSMGGKKMDEVAVNGKVKFIECLSHKSWAGEVLENPTWLDICGEAQKMIDYTGDRHHIFIEGITLVGEYEGVQIRDFSMGS